MGAVPSFKLEDGEAVARDRRALQALAKELGIFRDDAWTLEREAVAMRPRAGPS